MDQETGPPTAAPMELGPVAGSPVAAASSSLPAAEPASKTHRMSTSLHLHLFSLSPCSDCRRMKGTALQLSSPRFPVVLLCAGGLSLSYGQRAKCRRALVGQVVKRLVCTMRWQCQVEQLFGLTSIHSFFFFLFFFFFYVFFYYFRPCCAGFVSPLEIYHFVVHLRFRFHPCLAQEFLIASSKILNHLRSI